MSETSMGRDTQFRQILRVINKEGLRGESLTASEIYRIVEDEASVSSSHEVATVLGYHSKEPFVNVIEGSPYEYEIY